MIVANRTLSIETGWRSHILLETLDLTNHSEQIQALYMMYGNAPDVGEHVARNAAESLERILEFHMQAYEYMKYGEDKPSKTGSSKRIFDWHDDQSLILADFRTIYDIDLMTYQAHWYEFMQLFRAMLYREDSLLGQAMSARSPISSSLKGEMRKHAKAKQKMWSLPLTQDELNEIELAKFNS